MARKRLLHKRHLKHRIHKRHLSFKRGTTAQHERSKLAKAIKRSGSAINPFAVATSIIKRKRGFRTSRKRKHHSRHLKNFSLNPTNIPNAIITTAIGGALVGRLLNPSGQAVTTIPPTPAQIQGITSIIANLQPPPQPVPAPNLSAALGNLINSIGTQTVINGYTFYNVVVNKAGGTSDGGLYTPYSAYLGYGNYNQGNGYYLWASKNLESGRVITSLNDFNTFNNAITGTGLIVQSIIQPQAPQLLTLPTFMPPPTAILPSATYNAGTVTLTGFTPNSNQIDFSVAASGINYGSAAVSNYYSFSALGWFTDATGSFVIGDIRGFAMPIATQIQFKDKVTGNLSNPIIAYRT